MIERDFVKQKKREYAIQRFITSTLTNVGHSYTELQRTPLGDKVIIHTSRPGLVVGRKGQNISQLTEALKIHFKLENPQVEISEVEQPNLDASIVAERISSGLERFGANRFKGIMHRTMQDVLDAGAIGVEIRLSGKLPGSRAKSWRVYGGYLKKCGDAALTNVRKAIVTAKLKSGVIGIQVKILPPGVIMPDVVKLREEAPEEVKETEEKSEEETKETEETEEKKEAKPKKKRAKKKAAKSDKPEEKTEKSEDKAEEVVEEKTKEKTEKSEDKTEEVVEEKTEEKSDDKPAESK